MKMMPKRVAKLVYKELKGVELVIYFKDKSNVAVYCFLFLPFFMVIL